MKASWISVQECVRRHKWLFVRLLFCLVCSITCFVMMAAVNGSGKNYIVLCFFLCFAFLFAFGFPHRRGFFFWLTPSINFFLVECFYNAPFANIHLFTIAFNVFLFYLAFLFIWYITENNGLTVIISSVLSYIIGFANYAVLAFRQNPILPWDLLSVGTAMKVVNNYTLPITSRFVLLLACFIAVIFLGISLIGQKRENKIKKRVISSCVLAVLLGANFLFIQSSLFAKIFPINDSLFIPTNYFKENGYVVGFIRSLQYLNVDKPSGYSEREAEELLAGYSASSVSEPDRYPNIIVVMNETFSDLSVLGDFSTSEDYMPYLSSLSENTVKGKLHVSVKGGNTANSEFEFLTGNTMAFLPTGSVPYELYLKDYTPSIASYLKQNFNYKTYAVHPYYASAWRRNSVYPLLGFDDLTFIDDFDSDAEKIRGFTSDAAVYDKIIDLYENRALGERFFTFCVTLQNHGGYDILHDNFQPSVTVEGLEDDVSLTQYLSLIKESDAVFKELVDYFSSVDEPTIILMFGDHQPTDSAIQGLLEQVNLNISNLEEFEKQYITDFVIWTNYDIEEDYIEEISCNYLSSVLFDYAGISLSPYQNYLEELRIKYPVITANCIVNQNGMYFPSYRYDESKDLVEYSKVQHYQIFD